MKIILFALNASFSHTNLAVRCLKTYVEKQKENEFDIEIVEKHLKDRLDEVLFDLYDKKADVYAFSLYIFNIDQVIYFAKALKELLPQAIFIFGGPEVSYDSQNFLKENPFVDFIIQDEGEEAFYELLKKIKKNKQNLDSLDKIIKGQKMESFEQAGIPYSIDDKFIGSIIYYESSRGCPYKCSYCMSSLTRGVRAKSVEDTLKDLYEFESFGDRVKVIKFVDRTFNFDIERAKGILEGLLDEKYTKVYHLEIRAELIDQELFDVLDKFPKDKLQIETGIQSTNYQTLEAIDRPSDIKKALDNIKKLKEQDNINVHCDLIAGLPYDDMNTIEKGFNDIFYISHEVQLGFLKLLKGAKIRENAKDHEYKFSSYAPYEILSNTYLSYIELFELKRIAALTERFKNSVHFQNSLYKLIGLYNKGAFTFFRDLNTFANKHIASFSQHHAFMLLYDFAKKNIKNNVSQDDWYLLVDFIRSDYRVCQNREASAYFSKEG